MAVITVRIDEETKRMMDGIDINWSEVIRRAIRERIEERSGGGTWPRPC